MYQTVHSFARLLRPVLTLEDVEPKRFLFVWVHDYRNTFIL